MCCRPLWPNWETALGDLPAAKPGSINSLAIRTTQNSSCVMTSVSDVPMALTVCLNLGKRMKEIMGSSGFRRGDAPLRRELGLSRTKILISNFRFLSYLDPSPVRKPSGIVCCHSLCSAASSNINGFVTILVRVTNGLAPTERGSYVRNDRSR